MLINVREKLYTIGPTLFFVIFVVPHIQGGPKK